MFLCCWGQEDVEDHSEDHKGYISQYTQPEAWVFEQLLVVSTEEDVADGHTGHDPCKVSHKGHLHASIVAGKSSVEGKSKICGNKYHYGEDTKYSKERDHLSEIHHCVHKVASYQSINTPRRSHQSTERIKDGAGQRSCQDAGQVNHSHFKAFVNQLQRDAQQQLHHQVAHDVLHTSVDKHVGDEAPCFLPALRLVCEATLPDAFLQGHPLLLRLPHSVIDKHCQLCNTDEDDEDGGRAAVGPFQVLAADVCWKHPFGDRVLELLTTSHLSATVRLVPCAPERSPISVDRKRFLLLDVNVLHHCVSPKPPPGRVQMAPDGPKRINIDPAKLIQKAQCES